jgi:hypothetical protein
MGWRAVGKTGTTYTYRDGILTIDSKRSGHIVMKPWTMQSSVRASSNENPLPLPWKGSDSWENVDVPRVGTHLYVANPSMWRISTEIQSVEQLEDSE